MSTRKNFPSQDFKRKKTESQFKIFYNTFDEQLAPITDID